VTHEANTQGYTSKAVEPMSDQQTQGAALFLVGVAALIVSVGTAWMQARRSHAGRVQGAGMFTAVSFLLFLVGAVLCWFGVSTLLGG
jgi:hypothetical protein